jgi:DNA-binding MarR family transcriptional regulator
MERFAQIADTIAAECACLQIRQVSRLLSRLYDESLRETGLQMSQVSVLVAVAKFGQGGARITSLARVLAMDRTTVTRNLRPLVRSALLRVAPASSDARARAVLLTPAGQRALEAAFPHWERAQKKVRLLIGSRKADELRARLGGVLGAVRSRDETR